MRFLCRVIVEGEIKKVNPHALRHTLATRLVEGNVPLNIVQGILGHASMVGAFGFGRTLDNQVRFLCRVIVEDFNVRF